MILSAHQPAYLPWLGYFDKIAKADVFVYLDSVQFEKNSFTNRNRIKTPQGPQWLTIPVKMKGHLSNTLRDTEIDLTQPWRARHLKSIAMSYSRAEHFRSGFARLEGLFADQETLLAELCWRQLRFWLDELQIDTRIVRASTLPISDTKSDLVLQLCRHFGAQRYISGALGRDYLVAEDFAAAGIELEFQQFTAAAYPQQWGEFLPNLSIVDAWLNCGPAVSGLLEGAA